MWRIRYILIYTLRPGYLTELDTWRLDSLHNYVAGFRPKPASLAHSYNGRRVHFYDIICSGAAGGRKVGFRNGEDGEPWTWVMGEHPKDKTIDQMLEEEAQRQAMNLAEHEAEATLRCAIF